MGMIEIGPRDELNKLYNKPANRKIKYCAVVAISITLCTYAGYIDLYGAPVI